MIDPVPVFRAQAVDLDIRFRNPREHRQYMKSFEPGADLDIIIMRYSGPRTLDQNAYYWGVIIPIIANYMGHDDPNEVHEDLKRWFNVRSTRELDTLHFHQYIELIRRWAATDCHLNIPDPDPSKVYNPCISFPVRKSRHFGVNRTWIS